MIFIEDHGFAKRREALLDDDEFFELLEFLAARPEIGKVIKGSGGLRKIRWALRGQGKRGGARVIYFWWISDDKVLLLDIYPKNEKEDLSSQEIKQLRKKVMP